MEIVQSEKNLDQMLAEAENDRPVYIINTSIDRSVAILNLVTPGTGKVVPFHIHSTWIPQELFPRSPKDILLNCVDLRQYITKGLITLVDTDWAEKILGTEDAKFEQNQLNISDMSIFSGASGKKSRQAEAQSGKSARVPDDFKQSVQDMKQAQDQEELGEPEVNDRIKGVIAEFDSNKIELRSVLSELRNLSNILTDKDYGWLFHNTTSAQIKNFAKKNMSSYEEESEVEEISSS